MCAESAWAIVLSMTDLTKDPQTRQECNRLFRVSKGAAPDFLRSLSYAMAASSSAHAPQSGTMLVSHLAKSMACSSRRNCSWPAFTTRNDDEIFALLAVWFLWATRGKKPLAAPVFSRA